MADRPADELDLTRMNLTWANLKLWFVQHRVYIGMSLLLTVLFWAGIEYIYHPNAPLSMPIDAKLAWGNTDSSFQVIQQGTTLTLTRYRGGAQVYLLLFLFYISVYFTLEILAIAAGRDGKPPHHRHIIAKHKNRNWFGLLGSILGSLLVLIFMATFWLGIFYPVLQAVTYTEVVTIIPDKDLISWNDAPLMNISQVQYFYGKRHDFRIKTAEWGAHLTDGEDFPFNVDAALSSDVYDMDWSPSLVVFLNRYLNKTPPRPPSR